MIPPFYDSMIGKLIVHAATRDAAMERLAGALAAFEVDGVPTTIGLHRAILQQERFRSNRIHTRWLEQDMVA